MTWFEKADDQEPDIIYRVYVDPNLGDAKVMAVGMVGVNTTDPLEGHYERASDLPEWIQEKIAVLSLLIPPDGPIEGVGRRIDRNVFWVYPEENS